MSGKIKYTFTSKMWKHEGPAAWHFCSLPKALSVEIRKNFQWQEEGWGRMKTIAKIADTDWETSIWFDSKMGLYVLPIKSNIRKKLHIEIDQNLEIEITI